jgi:hypothetical protein
MPSVLDKAKAAQPKPTAPALPQSREIDMTGVRATPAPVAPPSPAGVSPTVTPTQTTPPPMLARPGIDLTRPAEEVEPNWWDIPAHIGNIVEDAKDTWGYQHITKPAMEWWNGENQSGLGMALHVVTMPITLPVRMYAKGLELLGDATVFAGQGISFVAQATTVDNPLYRDGVTLDDFGTMWEYAQTKMSAGQALAFNQSANTRMWRQMLGQQDESDVDYTGAAPIFDVGFNPYDMTDEQQAQLAANAVYGLGTGSLDLGVQVALAAVGNKGAGAAGRATGLSTRLRNVKDLQALDREITDHLAGTRVTVAGNEVVKIAQTRNVNDIMASPLVQVWASKSSNTVQLLAKVDSPEDVRLIVLADRGDRAAIARLMADSPDYIFQIGDVSSKLADDLTRLVPEINTPRASRDAFLETAFKSQVERDSFYRQARDAFLAGDKDIASGGKWVNTTRNNRTMPRGTTGNQFFGKPGDLAGRMQVRAGEAGARIMRGEGIGQTWAESDNWSLQVLGRIGQAGPVTKTLQWVGGRKPIGLVTVSSARPDDLIEEVSAFVDSAVWTTGKQAFQITRKDSTGAAQVIETTGSRYRAEVMARLTAAQASGQPSQVAQVVREVEAEILSSIAHKRGVPIDKVEAVVKGLQDQRDGDQLLIQNRGYFYDADGSQVLTDPVFNRQLADSIYMLPVRDIDRQFGSLFENGLHKVDNGYEMVQRVWRTAVLFKPAYTLKNAVAEPLVASILAHGSIFSPDGLYTSTVNVLTNTGHRAAQATLAAVDRVNGAFSHVPGLSKMVEQTYGARMVQQNALIREHTRLLAEVEHHNTELEAMKRGERSPAWIAQHGDEVEALEEAAAKRLREVEDDLDWLHVDHDMPSQRDIYQQPTYGQMRSQHERLAQVLAEDPETASARLTAMADEIDDAAISRGAEMEAREQARLTAAEESLRRHAENTGLVQQRVILKYLTVLEETIAKKRARAERMRANLPAAKAAAKAPDKGAYRGGMDRVRDRWPNVVPYEKSPLAELEAEIAAMESRLTEGLAQYQRMVEPGYAGTSAQKAWLESLGRDQGPKATVLSTNIRQMADPIGSDPAYPDLGVEDAPRAYGEQRIRTPDGREYELAAGRQEITAVDVATGDPVGRLVFQRHPSGDRGTWEPAMVEVVEGHKRQGIATAMFEFAQTANPHVVLRHSDALTADGAQFARATSHSVREPRYRSEAERLQAQRLRASAERVKTMTPDEKAKYLADLEEAGAHLDDLRDRLNQPALDTHAARTAAEDRLREVEERFSGLSVLTAEQAQQREKYRTRILGGMQPIVYERREDGSLTKLQYTRRKEARRIGAQWKENERARLQGRHADIVEIEEKYAVTPGLFDPDYFGEAYRAEFGAGTTNRATFDPANYGNPVTQKLVRGGGTDAIDPFDPAYYDELEYITNRQIRQDPITSKILQGATAGDLRQWLTTPEGRAYADRMGWTVDNANNQVNLAYRMVQQYLPAAPIPEKMRARINRELGSERTDVSAPEKPKTLGEEATYRVDRWERESKGSIYRGLDIVAEHPTYGEIGRMALRPGKDGGHEIHDINAFKHREGIGTGMYKAAQEAGLDPRHSADRTDIGDAWAKKVGGEVPPRDPKSIAGRPVTPRPPDVVETPPSGEILPEGATLQDLVAIRDVSRSELQEILAGRTDLSPVHSGELVFQTATPVRRAMDTLWKNLATKPEERVGRFPGGQRYFERHLQEDIEFQQRQSGGKLTAEEINALRSGAAAAALRDVERTYYNIRRYSHPVYAMRYLTAFPGALYNSMFRMARLATINTGTAGFMADKFTNGFAQIGVDKDGNKTDDFTKVQAVVFDVPNYAKDFFPPGDRISIGLQSLDFVRPSPSFAWTVTVPLNSVLANKPDVATWVKDNLTEDVQRMLFPFGDPTSKARFSVGPVVVDDMIPSHIRDFMTTMKDEGDVRYVQTVNQYVQALMFEWEQGGRKGPRPTLDDAREAAAQHWQMEFAAKFAIFGGLSLKTAGSLEREEWQRINDAHPNDYQGAVKEFVDKFGAGGVWFTKSTTNRAGGVPPNLQAWNRMEENSHLVSQIMELSPDDPTLLRSLFGDVNSGFDAAVYNAQTHTKIPGTDITIGEVASSAQFKAEAEASQSWTEYMAAKAVKDATMVRYGYASLQSKEAAWLKEQWDSWVAEFSADPVNSAWAVEKRDRDFGIADRAVKTMTTIVSDRKFMDGQKGNPYFAAMATYVVDHADALAYYQEAQTPEERKHILAAWDAHVRTQILPLNSNFAQFYDRYLDENDLKQVG